MANQTFTNLLSNDKQFAAINQLPPKAPTSNINYASVTEGHEILFQARNVLKTHVNPSLSFLGEKQIPEPPNSPNNAEHLTHTKDSDLEARMRRMQANRVYAARYRLRKLARLELLKNHAESLEAQVSSIRSQLRCWESAFDELAEENAMIKAKCEATEKLIAEKQGLNWALRQELQSLREC
ncbi:hypothetical protein Fmac_012151 [Flemingia macrophylla]|uniref:BZIP domain-containing protein n=1 Tax=Flemingia macrophylla TaxID=520843 RepID=A0ABD1MPH9_9FABA